MMAEWHIYASGPNKNPDGQKFWRGDGVPKGQTKVRKTISEAKNSRATQVYWRILEHGCHKIMRMEI